MESKLRAEIAAIAADSRSGATALLVRAVAVLRSAAADPTILEWAADALCRAQPAMAGLRVAAAVARRADEPAAALDAFAARVSRAPRLIARHAVALLMLRRSSGPVRLVTCSRSHAVEGAMLSLAERTPVAVACAEGRPALEGRDLARELAAAGLRVTVFSDAGIGTALRGADAFLCGADAVGPDAFINKVGTAALAALAVVEGVPVYVLAGREKVVSAETFSEISADGGGPADELWPSGPADVVVSNPYFELVRSTLVAGFVTDAGVLASADLIDMVGKI